MPDPDLGSDARRNTRLIIGVIAAVLILAFIAGNTRQTKTRFLLPEVTVPLWVALFVAALLGAVAGALITRHLSAPTKPPRKRQPRPDKPER